MAKAKRQIVHTFGIKVGQRCLIRGKHPHAGRIGEYVRFERTIFGERPVVKFENGDECFVMNPEEWGPVPE